MAPTQGAAHPALKGASPSPQQPWLPKYAEWSVGAIQGKERGIQMLAGLLHLAKQ